MRSSPVVTAAQCQNKSEGHPRPAWNSSMELYKGGFGSWARATGVYDILAVVNPNYSSVSSELYRIRKPCTMCASKKAHSRQQSAPQADDQKYRQALPLALNPTLCLNKGILCGAGSIAALVSIAQPPGHGVTRRIRRM